MDGISLKTEEACLKESIVKNNIFMLGKLGIDLESPTCIVDLFNMLALFIEASEENKQTSKFLKELMENPNEKKYGIKEPEFVPENSESEENCTNSYSKQEIEDPPTADPPKTDKPTVFFPTVKLPEKALEKRPTTLLELKRLVSEKLKDVTDGTPWLINVPITRKLYEEALLDLEVKIYDIKAKRSEIIFLHQIDHFDFDGKSNFQWRIILRTPCKLRKTGVLYVMADKYHEVEKLWRNWKDNNNG